MLDMKSLSCYSKVVFIFYGGKFIMKKALIITALILGLSTVQAQQANAWWIFSNTANAVKSDVNSVKNSAKNAANTVKNAPKNAIEAEKAKIKKQQEAEKAKLKKQQEAQKKKIEAEKAKLKKQQEAQKAKVDAKKNQVNTIKKDFKTLFSN